MLSTIADIALRSSVVYLIILAGLRVLGKSHMSQLSIIDFVLVLLLSNAVQNAMVGNDSSLIGGVVAAATLLLLNYFLSVLLFRFRKADKLLEGSPTLLLYDGTVIQSHLDKEKITLDELKRVVREHGFEHLSGIKSAVMELDGTISIIPNNAPEHHIESFKHHRLKFQKKDI
jgi:uncharacterized membrane protein YcaP (DUF421 family)